jgi:hypothetical protein
MQEITDVTFQRLRLIVMDGMATAFHKNQAAIGDCLAQARNVPWSIADFVGAVDQEHRTLDVGGLFQADITAGGRDRPCSRNPTFDHRLQLLGTL